MPAPKGNTNRQNDPLAKAEANLHVRCTRQDKGLWVLAARPDKLSEWVIKTLNQAAREEIKTWPGKAKNEGNQK